MATILSIVDIHQYLFIRFSNALIDSYIQIWDAQNTQILYEQYSVSVTVKTSQTVQENKEVGIQSDN